MRAMNTYLRICLTALAIAPTITHATEPPPKDYDGAALYMSNCSGCHGEHGGGEGISALNLAVEPQDLRYIAARANGEFPRWFIEQIVDGRQLRLAHGPDSMPVWGTIFTRQEGLDPSRTGSCGGHDRGLGGATSKACRSPWTERYLQGAHSLNPEFLQAKKEPANCRLSLTLATARLISALQRLWPGADIPIAPHRRSRRCPVLKTGIEPAKEQGALPIGCIGQVFAIDREGQTVATVIELPLVGDSRVQEFVFAFTQLLILPTTGTGHQNELTVVSIAHIGTENTGANLLVKGKDNADRKVGGRGVIVSTQRAQGTNGGSAPMTPPAVQPSRMKQSMGEL